ncbi:MAG TPA: gephyrin-like molybdotransferase Glp [Methylococcaceae bacterium]|nr:gephyrin-like molybdotransferase Glp [Methylococcaceae bacterium]
MPDLPQSHYPSCVDNPEVGALRADEALARILGAVAPVRGREFIPLPEAVGRVLDQDVASPFDVPGHRNSAVDGYAVRAVDLPAAGGAARLNVIGAALAGKPFGGGVGAGEAVRVMTGAPLPEGADTALMQEHVRLQDGQIIVGDRHGPGENVRQAGEDLRRGEIALRAGRLLTPADIGLLASLGLTEIPAKRRVRVAVLSTGDELTPLGEIPAPGTIHDSNRYSLLAALRRPGVETLDLGIARDKPEELRAALSEASRSADVLLTTGGVSVGEADYVRPLLAELGRVDFWKIAIKPGRPLAFGRIGDCLFFGLPGNPVAVLVTYGLFVRPALFRRMGVAHPPHPLTLQARLTAPLRKRPGRTEYPRGFMERAPDGEWQVTPFRRQGSGILRSMSESNALIHLPFEAGNVAEGDWVEVEPFAGWFGGT